MNNTPSNPNAPRIEIPGHVTWLEGNGGLPKVRLTGEHSEVEVYLHGAHISHFQIKGKPPILFMSGSSRFEADQPIRGGIPVIFPWFGPKEGAAAHGFARISPWRLTEVAFRPAGELSARFLLGVDEYEGIPFTLILALTLTDKLSIELITLNRSKTQSLVFEDCLHTYFQVGDIRNVRIRGLNGVHFRDKTDGFAEKVETRSEIDIAGETDRVYMDTTSAVDIHDGTLGRTIRVEKSGSLSTVVWNPWAGRAKQLPDFGDEEYHHMVCVESGNVGKNRIELAPGDSTRLGVTYSIV